jgi:hypothetical protein
VQQHVCTPSALSWLTHERGLIVFALMPACWAWVQAASFELNGCSMLSFLGGICCTMIATGVVYLFQAETL